MSKFTFEEQVKYFEKKLNLPTNSYLDVLGEEHDYFFMVAGANRNEVLLALREMVDDAIHNGATIEDMRKRFDEMVAKTGWAYNGGRNWRTRIIYDTNVYAAYNRGRLKQHLDLADVMPYWEYNHHDNEHPREEHIALDGIILRYDDPFWQYYYPIKAYGCHCTVTAYDEDDLAEMGKTVSPSPEIEWVEKTVGVRSGNPRTVRVPKGYDVGFAPYNFERLTQSRDVDVDKLLLQKMTTAEPHLASLLIDDVLKNPKAMVLLNGAMKDMVDTVSTQKIARGNMKYVGVIPENVITKLDNLDKAPQSAVIAVRDDDVLHALRDSKQAKGISLPVEFWEQLPEKLRNPSAILLETDQKLPTLVFVYDTEQGKVAIKMDYEVKLKDELSKKKFTHKVNLVRTASIFTDKSGMHKYEVLWGEL